jgi:hypothetical protein
LPDFIDKSRKHSVIVADGSGVLINPAIGEYSYVITAKHVIKISEEASGYRRPEDIEVKTFTGEIVELATVYVHQDYDIAVLVTRNKIELDLKPAISKPVRDGVVYFYGYPGTRRGGNPQDILREFQGQVKELGSYDFVVELDNSPNVDQVKGASGGGVFTAVDGELFLSGIEYRMQGDTADEHHGKVVCLDIQVIDTLLETHELGFLYPSLLNSFCDLVSRTFTYYDQADDPDNVRYLKDKLRERATAFSHTNAVSPLDVYKAQKQALLISESPIQDLYHEMLWVSYLEFLVISGLIDEVGNLEFSYIEKISLKRRFLFSAHKGNWVQRLRDIYRSDFRGLEVGGIIVVSTGDPTGRLQAKEQFVEEVVKDIGRTKREALMVDAAISNPVLDFKVFNLTGMHRTCVVDKEYDYKDYYAGNVGFDESDLIAKIIGEYRAYL